MSENTKKPEHADKYDDPRVRITRRGLLLGVAVVLFGILGAGLSIWARRTKLEKTTEFWGQDVITGLQLAEEVELIPYQKPSASPPAPESGGSAEAEVEPLEGDPGSALPAEARQQAPIRLSGMPGLGHLRHVLLDDRSYDWDSVRQQPVEQLYRDPSCMVLRLTDPTAHRFSEVRLVLGLDTGWVGRDGGSKQIRLNDRFQNAMPNFLKRIADYEPVRLKDKQSE
jgi:hypothetical protein